MFSRPMFRPVGRISRFSNLAGGEKSVVVCVCFCCDQTGSSVRFKKDGFICCVLFCCAVNTQAVAESLKKTSMFLEW